MSPNRCMQLWCTTYACNQLVAISAMATGWIGVGFTQQGQEMVGTESVIIKTAAGTATGMPLCAPKQAHAAAVRRDLSMLAVTATSTLLQASVCTPMLCIFVRCCCGVLQRTFVCTACQKLDTQRICTGATGDAHHMSAQAVSGLQSPTHHLICSNCILAQPASSSQHASSF